MDPRQSYVDRHWGHQHDDPRQIHAEINHTRAAMDRTISELRERVSPRRLIGELTDRLSLGGGQGGVGAGLVDAAKTNPVPLALLGAAIAWLVVDRTTGRGREHPTSRSERGRYDQEEAWLSPGAEYIPPGMGQTGPRHERRLGKHLEGPIHGAQRIAKETGHTIEHAASGIRRGFSEASHTVRGRAEQVGQHVGHQARNMQRGLRDAYDDYPLALSAAALTLGLIGGMALPQSETENRLMGETSEEVARRAKEAGRQIAQSGKEVARGISNAVSEGVARPGDLAGKIREGATAGINAAVDETQRQARKIQDTMPRREGPSSLI
jgi:uncharacterized protein DUF3618